MLEHLVGVDDVERRIVEFQPVDIPGHEPTPELGLAPSKR